MSWQKKHELKGKVSKKAGKRFHKMGLSYENYKKNGKWCHRLKK